MNTIIYKIANTPQLIFNAKRLCHDVYLQAGYIKEAFTGGIIPYPYDSSAVYIVALNAGNEVLGTLRLAMACPFKTLELWNDSLYYSCKQLICQALKGNAFEIGALAIRKDYSYTGVSFGLYKTAYDYSLSHGLDYAVITMDQRAIGSLEKYGWYFIKIGEPREYFGSVSIPAIIPINEQAAFIPVNNLLTNKH